MPYTARIYTRTSPKDNYEPSKSWAEEYKSPATGFSFQGHQYTCLIEDPVLLRGMTSPPSLQLAAAQDYK